MEKYCRSKDQVFHFGYIKFELLISSFSEDFKKAMDRGNCFKEVSGKEKPRNEW